MGQDAECDEIKHSRNKICKTKIQAVTKGERFFMGLKPLFSENIIV